MEAKMKARLLLVVLFSALVLIAADTNRNET